MACLVRPRWASLMTSWTPCMPRSRRRERRNAVQKSSVSLSPTSTPKHFAVPVGGDAGGDHDCLGHDPPADAGLAVGRIEEHIRRRLDAEIAFAPGGDVGVELTADPADLGLGDAGLNTERGDQVVDLAGRDPFDPGLHHHGVQRDIDAAARRGSSEGGRTTPNGLSGSCHS